MIGTIILNCIYYLQQKSQIFRLHPVLALYPEVRQWPAQRPLDDILQPDDAIRAVRRIVRRARGARPEVGFDYGKIVQLERLSVLGKPPQKPIDIRHGTFDEPEDVNLVEASDDAGDLSKILFIRGGVEIAQNELRNRVE